MLSSRSNLLPTSGDQDESVSRIESYIQKIFPNFKIHSTVGYLTLSQVLIFVCTIGYGILSTPFSLYNFVNVPICTLYTFGSTYGASMVHNFQIYRIVTPIFLHANIFHLVINMFSQIQLFLMIETNDYISKRGIIFLYLVSGVTGSIASMALHPYNISVGASGALYGLLGYLGMELKLTWSNLEVSVRNARLRNFLFVLALNLMITFGSPYIDTSAHLGGLLTGALLTVILWQSSEETSISKTHRSASILLLCLICISSTCYLYVEKVLNTKPNC